MNTNLMPNFWKLSHGWKEFSFLDMVECIDEKLVYIHRTTAGKGQSSVSQAEEFVNAPIGDYFYLTKGCTCLVSSLARLTTSQNTVMVGWTDHSG